ncbi:MAG TPA: DNA-processing protein DprA [Gammaproteobacteria bacterium]
MDAGAASGTGRPEGKTIDPQDALDWLTLIRAPRLGIAGALRLLQHCGSAAGCFTSDLPPALDLQSETRAWLKAPGRASAEQDKTYPPRNREPAEEIIARGVVVSASPPGTPPMPTHSRRRSRITDGLSLGTRVVEAAKQSGSLIAARTASEQGREMFAIPGSIHNPVARGCHRLLRDGTKLVESEGDILEELAPLLGDIANPAPAMNAAQARVDRASQDPDYALLLNSLDFAPTSVDSLVERTGLTPDVVSSMLLMLALQRHVEASPGGRYSRVNKRS